VPPWRLCSGQNPWWYSGTCSKWMIARRLGWRVGQCGFWREQPSWNPIGAAAAIRRRMGRVGEKRHHKKPAGLAFGNHSREGHMLSALNRPLTRHAPAGESAGSGTPSPPGRGLFPNSAVRFRPSCARPTISSLWLSTLAVTARDQAPWGGPC